MNKPPGSPVLGRGSQTAYPGNARVPNNKRKAPERNPVVRGPDGRPQPPGVLVGRKMPGPQVQLRASRTSHQRGNRPSLPDGFGRQESRYPSTFGEGLKLMETEKSHSILSFNWKEENLLKKQLSFLEAMKKSEANAWLMEQKAFYKRCHSKLRRLELAHARLLGNKDLVQRLTSKNVFSTHAGSLVDESEAAVKAIIQSRRGRDGTLLSLSPDRSRLHPDPRSGFLKEVETQEASRVNLKADLKEESSRTPVKIRKCPSGREGKLSLVLSLESSNSPEQEIQETKPVASSPPWEGHGAARDFSRRPPGTLCDDLREPAPGWRAKGRFLKYIVYGDSEEHADERRPGPRPGHRSRGGVSGW